MSGGMERARAIADAVLYEGYLLYPYRASAAKNRVRWQWGVVMPASYGREPARLGTELLVDAPVSAIVHVRLRFLHLRSRVVVDGAGAVVPSMVAGGVEYTAFEEAVEREVDAAPRLADLLGAGSRVPFEVDGGEEAEEIPGGRLVRTHRPLRGELSLRAEPLAGPYGGLVLRLDVANTCAAAPRTRDEALEHALIGAHVLLSVSPGGFLSLLDPPEWAAVAARECRADGLWPVLAGEPGSTGTVLCAPIILYDHPAVAAESAGELFDGTEIDEILTLRTMALTEEEKRQARSTDPRAAELIDRVDHLPPELLERLHGAIRGMRPAGDSAGATVTGRPATPWWDPGADASVSPETDRVLVGGVPVAAGSRVRLRPGRRADAQDMFLAGREALVRAVLHDVDGNVHLAVALGPDDPFQRFRYFAPDEVEPL
ncbi:hypothetical protein [Nonomuraea sp. NPDC050643]|uniref:hypothetical protein n=1 Tax=Nonomuraea sp. NPDC050643 TaxID=3155660 RepID=UPI0033D7E10B